MVWKQRERPCNIGDDVIARVLVDGKHLGGDVWEHMKGQIWDGGTQQWADWNDPDWAWKAHIGFPAAAARLRRQRVPPKFWEPDPSAPALF